MKKMISAMLALTTILACIIVVFPDRTDAASAVAHSPGNGIYGYEFGLASVREAESEALRQCRNYGGYNCSIMVSTPGGGYGAIAVSAEGDIGSSVGFASSYEAQAAALQECEYYAPYSCYIDATWHDTIE